MKFLESVLYYIACIAYSIAIYCIVKLKLENRSCVDTFISHNRYDHNTHFHHRQHLLSEVIKLYIGLITPYQKLLNFRLT
jgi:hypothetical protein